MSISRMDNLDPCGIGADFVARIQRPGWRPMETLPSVKGGGTMSILLDSWIGFGKVRRKNTTHTRTFVCKRCGATATRGGFGRFLYCHACSDELLDGRNARRWQQEKERNRAAKERGT